MRGDRDREVALPGSSVISIPFLWPHPEPWAGLALPCQDAAKRMEREQGLRRGFVATSIRGPGGSYPQPSWPAALPGHSLYLPVGSHHWGFRLIPGLMCIIGFVEETRLPCPGDVDTNLPLGTGMQMRGGVNCLRSCPFWRTRLFFTQREPRARGDFQGPLPPPWPALAPGCGHFGKGGSRGATFPSGW